MTLVRERKGDERDGFLRWRAKDLPCGAPSWLVLAAGAKAGAGSTLLAGGPKGITAVDSADGRVRWSVPLDGPTLTPALAGGRLFLTTDEGRGHRPRARRRSREVERSCM